MHYFYLLNKVGNTNLYAEKTFGKRGSTILMADGSEVEELSALRENDHPFIF
jgi:hypothetical protein